MRRARVRVQVRVRPCAFACARACACVDASVGWKFAYPHLHPGLAGGDPVLVVQLFHKFRWRQERSAVSCTNLRQASIAELIRL